VEGLQTVGQLDARRSGGDGMNLLKVISVATMGQPRRVRKMVVLTTIEYALRGAPYGVLLLAVWELFRPLQNPGTALDVNRMMLLTAALAVSLGLLFLATRKAYMAQYFDAYDIAAEGRVSLAEHLRRLPMGFFNSRDPGDVTAYLLNDYANVEFMFSHLVPQAIGAIALSFLVFLSLLFIDVNLALVVGAVVPLALPAAALSGKLVTFLGRKQRTTKVEVGSRMLEYLAGIRVVKAFNLQGVRLVRLESAFRRLKSESIRLEGAVGPTVILAAFILHAGVSLVMIAGLYRLLGGTLSIPVYLLFLILAARVYEPLLSALTLLAEMNYFTLGAYRIDHLRRTEPLPEPSVPAEPANCRIELQDVSFRYNAVDVLQNVSIAIPEKSMTALVGPSGSGKTTITRLVARFWDVTEGGIYIGGRNLRDIGTERLMEMVSVVFQDVYLFRDTISNNIGLGRRGATKEEIVEAAVAARCHDFIKALPDGYETMVGEGGSTLSGGEKQRVSIARAILKDAPIVMLDEPTSSLDAENAMWVQDAMERLTRNKTVLVIAHQLNTVMRADQIVVLNAGRVEQVGTHAELLGTSGLYSRMWQEQERAKGWKLGGRPQFATEMVG
jgi:ATP-binding cassette, subfamily B, bacterial IrtB/YbtQ